MSNTLIIIITSFSLVGLAAGLFFGFIVTDSQLQRGLDTVLKSIGRVILKTIGKRGKPLIDPNKIMRDKFFFHLLAGQKKELTDQKALRIATELKKRLEQQYGSRIMRVYLYGSRARGDYRPESDIDIAIIFKSFSDDYENIKKELLKYSFELLLKYGLYVQPRIYDNQILNGAESYPDYLAKVAINYGILI